MITLTELLKPGIVAVVTGSSSGIGRAASLRLATKGVSVWMLDIDAAELEVARLLVERAAAKEGSGATVRAVVVNVADEAAMKKVSDDFFAAHTTCHILFNNAGIGLGGGALSEASIVAKTMGVNFYGPLHGCLAFIPRMKEKGEAGIIINTASKQGITMPPGNLTYNTSKAALKCYTEGLEHELMKERVEGTGKLRAILLVPGWVNTSILLKTERITKGDDFDPDKCFFHEGKPQGGAWMPNQVVDFLIEEADKGRFYVICPDNDVDRKTDKLRMTWTMQDITEDRQPLSRWHPDFKDKFEAFLKSNKE